MARYCQTAGFHEELVQSLLPSDRIRMRRLPERLSQGMFATVRPLKWAKIN